MSTVVVYSKAQTLHVFVELFILILPDFSEPFLQGDGIATASVSPWQTLGVNVSVRNKIN